MINKYKICGEVTEVYVKNNDEKVITVLIDTTELNKVINSKFRFIRNRTGMLYVATGKGLLHRIITNAPKGMVVDHINHNTFDNRKQNLRVVTQQQNSQNQLISKQNTSGFKGVSYHKNSGKWEAYIRVNFKKISLGKYESLDKAAQVAFEARARLFEYSLEAVTANQTKAS